ncbi:MAG: hypothetical protein FWG38_08045 [Defluviitaleaceae bacterium]|nr:hypothetical protein [Defluviitaleaceae bacterium]
MHSNHVNHHLIQMTPCMAMDAICLLTRPTDTSYYRPIPEMEALVANIRQRLGSAEDNCQNIAFSNLGLMVCAYTDNIGLESLDLDGLTDIFRDGERLRKVVKAKTTNEFLASFIHPTLDMMIEQQWNVEFCRRLNNLKYIGFEGIWREKVLPLVQTDIKRKYQTLEGANIQALLTDISKMKGCPPIQDVKIFVSYFSYPTAFTLYNNSYLDCVENFDTFRIVAHELMHGFADAALVKAYREYVAADPYLSREYERLMKGSGDEEEFVTAADFYLQFLHGGKTKAALLPALKNIYGGMMPTALVLFDMLCQEPAAPADYNGWLLDKFGSGAMPGGRTGEYRERVMEGV